MKKHTLVFTNKCSDWLCMYAHSLIMVKIELMAGYIFLLDKRFSSLLTLCTIFIVHGFKEKFVSNASDRNPTKYMAGKTCNMITCDRQKV